MTDWLDYALDSGTSSPGPTLASSPRGVPQQPAHNDDFLFEDPNPTAPASAIRQPAPQQAASPSPNAEPDASSWIGRRAQDVLGKRDARYQGIPTIAEALKSEGNMGFGSALRESGAWLTGASDKDMAGVYKGMLGDRFVRDETDANGYPVIVYKGQDGREAKAYVNAPGLDMQDVVRGVEGIAPYVGAGRLVGGVLRGSAAVPRMVGQALGQGATSVVQDAAGVASGVSDLDIGRSVGKAGIAAAGGAAGEAAGQALSYAWRRLVTEPRYFNRSTGRLTQEGEAAARAGGLDPADLPEQVARDFGRAMANTGDATGATAATMQNEFGIPMTRGEVSGSTSQLLREQQMIGGGHGDMAARHMENFRAAQRGAVEGATRGMVSPTEPGMAGRIAPDRIGAPAAKADLGANIRTNTQAARDAARETERRAWADVPDDFRATDDALGAIDGVMRQSLAARNVRVIEDGITPVAARMSRMIEEFQSGGLPENASRYIDRSLSGHVDTMRRRLLATMEDTASNTDKRAAEALYDGFNDWIVEAARTSGDPTIAARLVTARGITREVRQAFAGRQGTPGARIMSSILEGADSPEGIVNAIFSAPSKSEIKNGAVSALQSLRQAYQRYLPREEAASAWNDVRLAFWLRTVENRSGQVLGPEALALSIRSSLSSQASLTRMLFSDAERSQMQRLAGTLERIGRRNPNRSWSGVSMGALMKDMGNAILKTLGGDNIYVRTAAGAVLRPVTRSYGGARAAQATGNFGGAAPARRAVPPIAGVGGGMGSEWE